MPGAHGAVLHPALACNADFLPFRAPGPPHSVQVIVSTANQRVTCFPVVFPCQRARAHTHTHTHTHTPIVFFTPLKESLALFFVNCKRLLPKETERSHLLFQPPKCCSHFIVLSLLILAEECQGTHCRVGINFLPCSFSLAALDRQAISKVYSDATFESSYL